MQPIHLSKKSLQDDKFLNALADAYRLQESIISTTELAIISTTPEGIITSFNRAAETMLGYTPEEVIGKVTPVIFHDQQELFQRSIELSDELNAEIEPNFEVFTAWTRAKKMAYRNEWTYVRKDGTRFPVMLSATALWDEQNNLTGYAGIASDITEQKRNEEKIFSSEAHLRALITALDDVVIEVNKQGVYTNIWTKNDQLLMAKPREHYVGKTLPEVLKEPALSQHIKAIHQVFETGKSQQLEYYFEEERRWSACKISYLSEDKVVILVRDIHQKKKAELALQESEAKFRSLAENIPGAIYLRQHDNTLSMLYLNKKIEEITGYSVEDFISGEISFTGLYHPDDKESIFRSMGEALAAKTSFHLEYRIRSKSGDWRWLEEDGIGIYSDDTLTMVEGFIADITQRKNAEEELKRVSDENYRVFNDTISLNCVATFEGYFIKLNQAWERTLGWSLEELQTKKFVEFIHPEDVLKTQEAFARILEGNDMATFENRYRGKDGCYHWLLWNSSPDMKRRIVYASAIDISERKKSEEELLRSKNNLEVASSELQEQNRQLDEFAHIISHNLRSPIGNIKALIGLLNEQSGVEDYKVIFEKLKNVSGNLSETMNELMETLKAKKNSDVEIVEIRFKEMLDKVIQSLEGDLIQCEASVTFDFNKAPKIEYSKTYMESIFQNLISNAIKYRSPDRKPEIHISSGIVGDRTELRVRDNGLGIDMERFGDQLFGLHKTFHENNEARGVGLFLTKTQIEAMGGSISASSEVNKGTTFIIRF